MLLIFSSGYNDNPTASQFEAAYRKLLIHNDVVCSTKANVIDPKTNILTVSSRRTAPKQSSQHDQEFFDEGFDGFVLEDDFHDSFHVAQYIDDSHSHSLTYMASVLEAKIIGGKRRVIKCEDCVRVFIENELLEDSFIRFKARTTNVMQPCRSTFEICKFVDNYVKSCENRSASFQAVVIHILRRISFDTLYTSSDFEKHSGAGHKYEFVKKIVELYMHMKSMHLAKCFTLDVNDEPCRHHLHKIVHEKGQ